uniref:Uncharacterized protein n=1 Tax=Panagrolaimus superbus TaxID=310955 RepID=A0A914Z755_9BILA
MCIEKKKIKPIVGTIGKTSPTKLLAAKSPRTSPRKFINPFRKNTNTTPAKKARIEPLSPRKASLRSAEKRIIDSPKSSKNLNDAAKSSKNLFDAFKLNSNAPLDFSSLSSICSSASLNLKAKKTLEFDAPKKEFVEIPVDLRPGYKLRVTSLKPFPWMKEARAKASSQVFIKNEDVVAGELAVDGVDLETKNSDILNTLNPMAKLSAITYYYQYPDLAKLQLSMFPRLDAQTRLSLPAKSTASLQQFGQTYVEATVAEWKQTFEKLYYKWRLSDRKTFYLFAHNSTIIFTKYTNFNNTTNTVNGDETLWAAHGKPKHRVIITPTTSGLRQILRDEDIKFELPLSGRNLSRRVSKDISSIAINDTLAGFEIPIKTNGEKKENVVGKEEKTSDKTKNQTPTKDPSKVIQLFESPGDEDNDNAIDHDEWLKDIGISPRSTLGFGRHATISDFAVYSTLSNLSPNDASQGPIDSSSANEATRSTAVITEPKSIQALFNFLCVTKDFRSTTGAQAGLPPTLISSSSFTNGTLKNLNISSQIVKRSRASSHEYIIEIENGPILPHMPSMLISFLESIPELSTKDNEIKVMVSGRNGYSGINECIDSDAYFNHSEFSYKPSTGSFFV